jgi:hypothetical protein
MEHIISHVTQILCNGYPYHGGERKHFEVMTQITPLGTLGSVASLLQIIHFSDGNGYFPFQEDSSFLHHRHDFLPELTI